MSLPTTGAGRSVWCVQFYQENDGIDFGSGGSIDDLLAADCTIEFYALVEESTTDAVYLLTKRDAGGITAGFDVLLQAAGALLVRIQLATTDISLSYATSLKDGRWHHYTVDFDVGTITARLFIDGVFVATSTGVGAYQADAAFDCLVNAVNSIGNSDAQLRIGPVRLSNSRRYTGASFDPPRRINWPANDANAQLITRMADGAGATVTDYSGNSYNGTITFGANTRWYNDPV